MKLALADFIVYALDHDHMKVNLARNRSTVSRERAGNKAKVPLTVSKENILRNDLLIQQNVSHMLICDPPTYTVSRSCLLQKERGLR